ncbi:ComEC/Rec2 family competence protein [Aquihabitans sp. McL0605]|uniref:ComEC/Rec2 family competence protein n=1 Tax=Aquihabitans sp. McL0605 TaxID=3415671 RepID=UPI003CF27B1A
MSDQAERSAEPAGASSPPLPGPLAVRGQLGDGAAVALAVAASLGAWWHRPLPLAIGVGLAVTGVLVRRSAVLVVAVFVLAGTLGARAYAGLAPLGARPFQGTVTLVADPATTPFGATADARVDGHRVEVEASGAAAGALGASLAGEVLLVTGHLGPPPPHSPWLVPRHVAGRLTVTTAERSGGGAAPWRAANRFRRLLSNGAAVMPEPERSLYGGFVLGDDRNQAPEIVDDFRGSGLTHVLVVSGQNVAYVLVLVAPVLRRLSWRGRWLLTIAVIGAFAVVTRFEPSVLRASAMAAIAVTAGAVGRPVGAVRTLALAVAGLVLIDPLLVRSVGFQLSVGASLAIAVLAQPIARLLPGPRLLAEAVGVTLAAQVGVAPVLIPRAGGLPVVSVVANPLAVPVAGVVTTWGLPAGVVAGIGGPAVARIVHLPTQVMIGWVAAVARIGASLPLGTIGWPHLAVLVAAALVAARVPRLRVGAGVVAVVALLAPALVLRSPPPSESLGHGAVVHRGGGATVVVLPSRAQPGGVLQDLRGAGVRRIDLLLIDGGDVAGLARSVRHRWPVGRVLDARTTAPVRLRLGSLTIDVVPPGPPEVVAEPP